MVLPSRWFFTWLAANIFTRWIQSCSWPLRGSTELFFKSQIQLYFTFLSTRRRWDQSQSSALHHETKHLFFCQSFIRSFVLSEVIENIYLSAKMNMYKTKSSSFANRLEFLQKSIRICAFGRNIYTRSVQSSHDRFLKFESSVGCCVHDFDPQILDQEIVLHISISIY